MILRYLTGSFLLILGALFLSACDVTSPERVDATPTIGAGESETSPALEKVPTLPVVPTAEPPPAGYPSNLPVRPTYPPGYPGPATSNPSVEPYPGGMVWMTRPVGLQCEDGTLPGYGDLKEAVATLTAAGLHVYNSEMADFMVTTSCGSPTSAHYRVQISAEDMDSAVSMGWDVDQS